MPTSIEQQLSELEQLIYADTEDPDNLLVRLQHLEQSSTIPFSSEIQLRFQVLEAAILTRVARCSDSMEITRELLKQKTFVEKSKDHAEILHLHALNHKHLGNVKESIQCFTKAALLFDNIGNKRGIFKCFANLSVVLGDHGNYASSLEYRNKAIEQIPLKKNESAIPVLYINNAYDYLFLGNLESAKTWIDNAENSLKETEGTCRTQINLNIVKGEYYLAVNQIDRAKVELLKASELNQTLKDQSLKSQILRNLARVESCSGNGNTAKALFEEVIIHNEASSIYREWLTASIEYGIHFNQNHEYSKAQELFERVLKKNETYGSKEIAIRCIKQLQTCAQANQDFKKLSKLLQQELELQTQHYYENEKNKLTLLRSELDIAELTHSKVISQIKTQVLKEKNDALQETNQKLQEIDHDRTELMSLITHDVRSPLSSVISTIELCETGAFSSPEEILMILRPLGKQAKTTLDFLNNILALDRIENETIEPKFEEIQIANFLSEILEELSTKAQSKTLEIKLQNNCQQDTLTTEKTFLRTIAYNLLSNAIKYSPSNSTITMEFGSGENNKGITLSVVDEGPGIPPESIDKLFTKFHRTSNQPTGNETSTGVGLHLVKNFTERLSGKVFYEPNHPTGSIFRVHIPQRS